MSFCYKFGNHLKEWSLALQLENFKNYENGNSVIYNYGLSFIPHLLVLHSAPSCKHPENQLLPGQECLILLSPSTQRNQQGGIFVPSCL